MQLGFVIDHSRCIGCHACTVACKSENEVPVDSFRTWVKYSERGEFPHVRRSFAVLRCNQCTDAPCVTICPVKALSKRPDGIVDLDQDHCIGCKACMHGCPYDALYIHPEEGTAEKCHFCAHRTEQGLAPACAVVCPTEAIIPGDFHDPDSRVSQLRREHDLQGRKTEAGTGPNVLYREVDPAGIDPLLGRRSGSIWTDKHPEMAPTAADTRAVESRAQPRTVYDVAHPRPWGEKITAYLFLKAVGCGVLPALWIAQLLRGRGGDLLAAPRTEAEVALMPILAAIALVGLAVTSLLLVIDLKRPERFYKILIRPNFSSWLVRGTYLLLASSLLSIAWFAIGTGLAEFGQGGPALAILSSLAFAATAAYTGWLFGQAKGRVLWLRRHLWAHLVVKAGVGGAAVLALVLSAPVAGGFAVEASAAMPVLIGALVLHALFTALEGRLAPKGREREYRETIELLERGRFAFQHRFIGIGVGIALALVAAFLLPPAIAAVFALVGLWVEESLLVRAGQELAIS